MIRIGSKTDIPQPGEAKEFSCGDRTICVANVNGTISAMDNVCIHRGGPIAQGTLEGDKMVCPWHGWQWNTKTGEATHNPSAKVAVYPIYVEGEDLVVDV
jgi:nitrite reductase (NADH) small subunit